MTDARETATLGGGCFWCLEAAYTRLRGVLAVKSGYAGGQVAHPTYDQVCEGTTGHAEVVRVEFDPTQIAYRDLLEVFFTVHDPTQLNRQGADVGSQYRSIILYESDAQAATAREVLAELAGERVWEHPIVTLLEPLTEFWPAEKQHDKYYQKHPWQPYCVAVIAPKLAKLRAKHADKLAR